MRVKWTYYGWGEFWSAQLHGNRGEYCNIHRGKWGVNLYSGGKRVKQVYTTTEKKARRIIKDWVSIPF